MVCFTFGFVGNVTTMNQANISSITINTLPFINTTQDEFGIVNSDNLLMLFGDHSYKILFYILLIIEEGAGRILIDQEYTEIRRRQVFFINYHQVVKFSDIKNFSGEALIFTRSFYNIIYTGNRKIKNDTAFSDLPTFIDFTKFDFLNFRGSVNDIKKETRSKAPLRKELICLLLKVAMLKYIRQSNHPEFFDSQTSRKTTYIEDFKSLVDLHFKELKRTSDYAKKLAISANYLNALIKEKFDLSAENYIQNRVILEAERLLLNTDLSVTQISFELGFSDKSHFGKYFKKVNGKSPNSFRLDF